MKTPISFRIDPELLLWLQQEAKKQGRNITNMIEFLLNEQKKQLTNKKTK